MSVRLLIGGCRDRLGEMPDQSVQCVVTSPPYFGLRDYGVEGQMGAEPTPQEFVAALREVFREVWRVLRDDGTVWLNLGDSYAASQSNNGGCSPKSTLGGGGGRYRAGSKNEAAYEATAARKTSHGLKCKDLIGIPWRVAFALQDDGWYLRQDIIWHKPNPMPESVRDRCTKAHEYLFMLTKSPRYYYDAEAIKEQSDPKQAAHNSRYAKEYTAHSDRAEWSGQPGNVNNVGIHSRANADGKRNKRSVWTVSTRPYAGAHFATFPPALIEPCIRAGTAAGDTVLDPFAGSGTTGYVADYLQRDAVLIEMNAEYAGLIRERLESGGALFSDLVVVQ